MLLVPLPLAVVAGLLGHGLLGGALLVLGLWPLPFRCRVDADGLRVSWLLVSQRIPWASVEATAVEKDARRWVIGTRRNVLVVRRAHRRPLTLSASAAILAELARDVAHFAPPSCQVLV
jgi:hypothetical protein